MSSTYFCDALCTSEAEHAGHVKAVRDLRAMLPKKAQAMDCDDPECYRGVTCPGCYLGDDGPTTHDFGYGCQYGDGA